MLVATTLAATGAGLTGFTVNTGVKAMSCPDVKWQAIKCPAPNFRIGGSTVSHVPLMTWGQRDANGQPLSRLAADRTSPDNTSFLVINMAPAIGSAARVKSV